jgi:hypothetical protein
MGTLKLVQALRRCRLALAVGAALALLIAVAGLSGKQTTTGFAVQRVLVDTPNSLLGDAAPTGSTGAAVRAAFIGNLAAAGPTVESMATRLGVAPREIAVVGSGGAPPGTMSPAAQKAVEASPPRQKYIITYGEIPGLPLLNVVATAPTEAAAKTLATAGTAALTQAAGEAGPAADVARVQEIGSLNSGVKTSGPRKATSLVMAIVFFIVWVFATLLVDRLLRTRRRERLEAAFDGWAI